MTKDAQGLRDALVGDAVSSIKYESEKSSEILAEDKVIGAMTLSIKPENVKIVPVNEVFSK